MAGIRDRLIHRYFGVNLDIVWDIVALELRTLEGQLAALLADCGD
ncbi:MAG: HepT-like ribonuclease domain-containing protein [Chloroflexota bacterium]